MLMYEDRAETIRTALQLGMQQTMLSRATGLDSRRMSDFMKRNPLPEATVSSVKETVAKIARVWNVFGSKVIVESPKQLEEMYETALKLERVVNALDAQLRLAVATENASEAIQELAAR